MVGADPAADPGVLGVDARVAAGPRRPSGAPVPPYTAAAVAIIGAAPVRDAAFAARRDAAEARVRMLAERLAIAAAGGSARAVERHRARGKLTARERIERLVDPGSAVLELSPLAAHEVYPEQVPAAGIVTALCSVEGRICVVVANDATVKGGTYFPLTVKKHLRAQEIARENGCRASTSSTRAAPSCPPGRGLPGPRPLRADLLQPGAHERGRRAAARRRDGLLHGGRRVRAGARRRDRDRARTGTIFLGGPPLVEAATGEIVTAEELGGSRVHARISGVADHEAEDDEHALALLRGAVRTLHSPPAPPWDVEAPEPPLHDADDLLGIVPDDPREGWDIRELIARIVDGSRFHEFKRGYGETLVCGFARIEGHPVAILGNNGVLHSDSALKGAHLVELACQRRTPLVFLQNITGFMVGSAAERGGIAKDGAKLVAAVATAGVPKLTVLVGGSYGAGNYGMCGRAYGPRLLVAWPRRAASP